MEKFLLNSFLAREELDVVNQQHVGLAVFLAELGELVVLDPVNVFVGELFGREISDARAFFVARHVLADGMEQMRLAQADPAVKEKRIVGFAGRLGHRQRGGVGEIVVVADDKSFKRILGIEMDFAAARRAFVRRFGGFHFGRHGRRRQGDWRAPGRNFEFDLQLPAGGDGKGVLQETGVVVLEPDFAEFVRRLEHDVIAIQRTRAQRGKPHAEGVFAQLGAELLLRQIPNFFCRKLHL